MPQEVCCNNGKGNGNYLEIRVPQARCCSGTKNGADPQNSGFRVKGSGFSAKGIQACLLVHTNKILRLEKVFENYGMEIVLTC